MPNMVVDLIVDRVDLVKEGANTASFIELFKRKEPINMAKPETLEEALIDLDTDKVDFIKAKISELEKANTKLNAELPCECDGEANAKGICKSCGRKKMEKKKQVCSECGAPLAADNTTGLCPACTAAAAAKAKAGNAAFDETEVTKGLPENVVAYINTLKSKQEAAESLARTAAEKAIEAEALTKAAELKSLPVNQDELVDILKTADSKTVELLSTICTALDATVLDEVGKSNAGDAHIGSDAAWSKIEAAAVTIEKSASCSHQKAISLAMEANPQLYRDYLKGGNE